MSWTFLLPLVVAVTAVASASALQRRLRPRLATWCLSAVAVGSAITVGWAAMALAVGAVAQSRWMAQWAGWCRDVYRADDRVNPWVGAGAALLLVVGAMRMLIVHRQHRRDLRAGVTLVGSAAVVDGLWVTESRQPIAYALPIDGGRVVVSTAMLEALNPRQCVAMEAHERSHLVHRHHRFVLAAELAAAAVPLLRPVAEQVRFATERWADEDAATLVGDRRTVAEAVGAAALVSSGFARGTLAFTGLGVRARVEALLDPNKPRPVAPAMGLAVGVVAVSANLVGSTVQLHHLIGFAAHVCNQS